MNWDFVLKKEGELALQKIQEKQKKKQIQTLVVLHKIVASLLLQEKQ